MPSEESMIKVVSLAEYARHQAASYSDPNDDAAIAFRHIANCIDAALDEAKAERTEECYNAVPTTWLDPLLSGPDADPISPGPAVEKLLRGIRDRIGSLTQKDTPHNA
jgi:hypothetical protein